MGLLQTAITAIYPPRCLGCGELVDSDFGLCGACWGETEFVGETACDMCGVPLPGVDHSDALRCDDCLSAPKTWARGRAALIYSGMGRKLVLRLKHGDRQEIARPAATWMRMTVQPLLTEKTLIVPVPLHWMRLAKRRYNQSAVIARHLAESTGLDWCPDLLVRSKRTQSLDGRPRSERQDILTDAIQINPKRRHRIVTRPVLLIDDVMTTGATLNACADACHAAGAGDVCVSVLARAVKRP
mmetsp:Transcript_18034/g.27595  ORF Transcript_18034/g.27595 Transcript_18034/m.27595 type:complete len:242 (-) Transcript_18034:5730-6455(-)